MNTNALRATLEKLMESNRISASAWSVKAGKSRNFVSEYLSGRAQDMTLGSIEALAHAIDLSVIDILEQAIHLEEQPKNIHKISQIRRVLGLSIKEFSYRTGIREDALHQIEAFKTKMTDDIVHKISQNLSIPLSEIL